MAVAVLGVAMFMSEARAAEFLPLGDLPGGAFTSEATDVSLFGTDIVGYSVSQRPGSSTPKTEAFVWQPSTAMLGLGYAEGGAPTWANEISGIIVGGSGSPQSNACMWAPKPGTFDEWVHVPFPVPGSTASDALGVSRDGEYVVGWGDVPGATWGFAWRYNYLLYRFNPQEAGGTDAYWLGLPSGASDARAYDIDRYPKDDPGWVSTAVGTSDGMPCRWIREGSGMYEADVLATPPGATGGGLQRITLDGRTMVGWATFPEATGEIDRAVRYEKITSTLTNMEVLNWEGASHALDVTPDGRTIVGTVTWPGWHPEAFIWDPDHGLRTFQTVLEYQYGLDLSGWTLQRATGISGDGLVIVGSGINPDGNTEAWRVVLDSSADLSIEEPPVGGAILDESLTLPVSGLGIDLSTNVTTSGVLSVAQARRDDLSDAALDEWREAYAAGFYPQMWSVDMTAEHGPVTLVFHYNPAGLVGLDEGLLCLYHWDEDGMEWIPEESIIEFDHHTITTTVEDLSVFSLGLVPEPATLALLALGGVGVLVRRRGKGEGTRASSSPRRREKS
ncbi:MAG: PEP-CTERM sorting domain-containing protein [Phycisphaerae bacterium]